MPKDWEDVQPTLDDLIADRPPPSPSVKVQIGGKIVDVAFRILSEQRCQWIQLEARKWLYDEIKTHELPPEDINSGVMLDLFSHELDIRLLAASCINPETGETAFSADGLRSSITPIQRQTLIKHWFTWQGRFTPDAFSKEEIEEFIDSVKKKGLSDGMLIKYGADMLLICISSLVEELDSLKTAKSLGGGSGTLESDDATTSSPSQPVSNWQNSFTKLSASLAELRTEVEALKRAR